MFDRASEYVELNLGRLDLSPASVASAVGVSRAVLYREFAAVAGVSAHIQDLRVSGAMDYLVRNGHRPRVVAETCERFGYASAARFSRHFRRRWGLTPAAFVKLVRAPDPR